MIFDIGTEESVVLLSGAKYYSEVFAITIEYAKKQNVDLIFGMDSDSNSAVVVVKANNDEYKVKYFNDWRKICFIKKQFKRA